MPYPSQIDLERIVQTAHTYIEAHGVENLSLRSLADQLNVRAPSLYRYVKNKTDLLRLVNEMTLSRLLNRLMQAPDSGLPARSQLMQIAQAYRQFVHDYPRTYSLAYTNSDDAVRFDEQQAEQGVLPLQSLIAEISGEADSLAAIRGAFALLHGWALLELSQQFRRGGDLNAAFNRAIQAYLDGWERD